MKKGIRKAIWFLLKKSLDSAICEQNLGNMATQLERIVPDISDQYTGFKVTGEFLKSKVRYQHCFQMHLLNKVLSKFKRPVVVDIGDSSGTHLKYLKGLYPEKKIECLSVNIDLAAVERIRANGLNGIHARAEEIQKYNIEPDVFFSFEMLEHLSDPSRFLHDISNKTQVEYMVVTVPYLVKSRVGLHHIRSKNENMVTAENTHIFELNPEDWKLLAMHSGWEVEKDYVYFQYPRKKPLRMTRFLWRKLDFEGFYGMVLKRNHKWLNKYNGWD